MEAIFDEEMIRAELKRLDEKTGLHGADLKIKFGNARCRLGCFYPGIKDEPAFYFSNLYFTDTRFPVEEKIDVIRHEYAHYMDYMLHGHCDHGPLWKQCCNIVGAFPSRCYNKERSDAFLLKHEKEAAANAEYDKFAVGDIIYHPTFGNGIITEINGEGLNRRAVVVFDNAITKRIAISWILKNCK